MATRDSRRRYRTAEVLEQLFGLPSDDELVDGMEGSDDDTSDTPIATSSNEAAAADVLDSSETDDDDGILYELADANADTDWSDEDSDDTHQLNSSTDDEETEWHKDAFVESGIDFDNITAVPQEPFVDGDGPLEFFSKFFTEEVLQLLAEQTNLYAQQSKTRHWDHTTAQEIKAFLGMLIAMQLPSAQMCWSTDPLFRIQPVADVRTRRRFMKLVGNLHVNDNSAAVPRGDPTYDRLHKIRPLLLQVVKIWHLTCNFLAPSVICCMRIHRRITSTLTTC